MPKTVNEILQDKIIRHQVGLLKLSSTVTNKLIAILNRAEDDVIKQLSNLGDDRLNVILKRIREITKAAGGKQYTYLEKELNAVGVYESDFVEQLLKGAIPVKFDMVTPSREMLSSIVTSKPFEGKLLKEWVEDLSENTRRKLRDAIRMGMAEGESIDSMARRIRGTKAQKYKDGIMEISRRESQAMVRTAVNHTATRAREMIYQDNDELISKVQWVATLDSRTCPFCQPLDGKTFPVDKGERPPLHINCRCCTVPVVKSFRELGFDIDEAPESTRASMNGQVPEKITYPEWLKGQSAKMQDKILGPARGKMFRDGVAVDKFVDIKNMEKFTLKELKAMDLE